MDELMNAALEQEQKTKKCELSPPKRRNEQGGSSSKKFKSNETYPRFGRKGYPQCTNYGRFHLEIDNEKFSIDLLHMLIREVDVVIRMDWLSKYDAIISCQHKLIRIRTPSGRETFIYDERKKTFLAICTYVRAKRNLARGCQAYLAHIIDTQKSTPCLDNILVVVMSSPNHPTSDIEDAFSSNFPDYIQAFPDYVPASLGKSFSESLNDSFGLVPIASPTLSLFHDDPYMKVMHAYYAKKSPILPPIIVPPSSMLSPMFNPQEFFLPEELLPPKKRGRDQSSSSTSTLLVDGFQRADKNTIQEYIY
uniref:Reverse transcriptase domain-containing protein n=1 Tax=Tanacetum cinerariifolium TaxID=118510 RepID=A0A699HUM4_TANCI|nr:reverse transcriptase domain-containing protein [Tanacetum cinerariifolium]